MARLLSALLLAGAAVAPVQASMAAWLTTIGPQVILLNETTNQIRYTACNMDGGLAKYSPTDGSVFSLSYPPRVGTPVTGVGWWNEKTTIASIWYINEQGNITNSLYNCNMSTGLFQSQGSWVISGDVPSIHSNSGLASVVLGAQAGYRVYFHDGDGAINELGYNTVDNWKYNGVISQDINSLPALGAAFSGDKNISIASPRDESNMAVVRLNKDDTWFRTTFPHPLKGNFSIAETNRSKIAINTTAATNFTLPGWDGRTRSVGVTIDKAFTRSLFYIGNDSSLHQVANQNFTWRIRNNTFTNASWPNADSPNADLAAAYSFETSLVRLYYIVKGQLSEIRFQNGTWHPYTALPTPPPRPAQTAAPSPSTDTSSSSGLSTGAKAGIGVGVSLGAIALGAIIAVVVLARRRQQQQTQTPSSESPPSAMDEGSTTLGPDTPALSYGSPTTPGGAAAGFEGAYAAEQKVAAEYPQQLDSTPRSELFVPQVYELPSQPYTHELEVAQQPPPPPPQQPPPAQKQ